MSVTYTYPGVYIQELPSPVHAIAGVSTSIAAFVGYTARGIDNRAEVIFSFSDFERQFGGLASNSELSYAVQQFFQNGGTQAYVVRVPMDHATPAQVTFDGLTFSALSSGAWANGHLLIDVDVQNIDLTATPKAFNLTVTDLADNITEAFLNVSVDDTAMNYVVRVVNDPDNGSQLVDVSLAGAPGAPAVTGIVGKEITTLSVNKAVGTAADGTVRTTASADFSLMVGISSPASTSPFPLTVKVFGNGTPIPQSLSGLAVQLQQAINAVLAVQLPTASVQCSISQIGSGSQAIRVNALLPNQPDAVITFGAPGSGTSDASSALGLDQPTTANVAHYALGTNNAYAIPDGETASPAGVNGDNLPSSQYLRGDQAQFTGLYALQKVDLFNLLSIPDATRALPSSPTTPDPLVDPVEIYAEAITFCDQRRAFLLVDPPPNIATVTGAVDWKSSTLNLTDSNGAAFFPRLRLPDPLNKYKLRTFAPSGVVAGVYATIDGSRGVWKAPAGTEATLNGVQGMAYQLSDQENGLLNPLGLNCFRTFPVYGSVLWGARTLAGADALASDWKYVPVRRLALFLEESLFRATKWAVFEPNDAPLWAAIRLNIGSFMQTLFLKGAFQGQTADQAYFVKCDGETTTQTDIDNGVVNILVGFAPLQPAEFVVIQIEQLTGQAQS